jgi:hypothetical protein
MMQDHNIFKIFVSFYLSNPHTFRLFSPTKNSLHPKRWVLPGVLPYL